MSTDTEILTIMYEIFSSQEIITDSFQMFPNNSIPISINATRYLHCVIQIKLITCLNRLISKHNDKSISA